MSATATIQILRPTNTDLIIVRKSYSNPLAIDMFAGDPKENWMRGYIESSKRFKGPFYPADVTAIFRDCPASSKWVGNAYKRMASQGCHKTGEWRNSPTKSRAGGIEFQWTWELL